MENTSKLLRANEAGISAMRVERLLRVDDFDTMRGLELGGASLRTVGS